MLKWVVSDDDHDLHTFHAGPANQLMLAGQSFLVSCCLSLDLCLCLQDEDEAEEELQRYSNSEESAVA